MIIDDDRTDEERISHIWLVVATDKLWNGCGFSKGGTGVAAWACKSLKDAYIVEDRIRERPDMKRVRIVHDCKGGWIGGPRKYRPKNAAHFSVSVVREDHRYLER